MSETEEKIPETCANCLYFGLKWLTRKQAVDFCYLFHCLTDVDYKCYKYRAFLDCPVAKAIKPDNFDASIALAELLFEGIDIGDFSSWARECGDKVEEAVMKVEDIDMKVVRDHLNKLRNDWRNG